MFLIILIKSLIIGGLVGVGVGAGAARMFHAPTTQGMGAFRTLGELNSCEGDPASHFSFGLGFFFNAWASSVAAGSFTQDVDHRIIPNWGAAALMLKNRNVGETLHDPKKMAISCGIIGMIVVAFLNLTASSVPEALQVTAVKVLVPAANLLVNTYAHIQQDSRKKLGKKFEEGFYKPVEPEPQSVPAKAEPTISVSALVELLKDADPAVKAQLRLALLT